MITLREKFVKMNELTGMITLSSGIQTRVADKRLVDSLEGTGELDYDLMACPQIVQLYKGLMKVYTNKTNLLEGSTAVVEYKDMDYSKLRLEIVESFILRGHQT
jgi:hypothetical protein